jgi:hypothetical protein
MAKTKEKEKDTGPRARNDAYVMMLVITFFSILVGSLLMYLDYAGSKGLGIGEDPGYGSRTPPKETITPPPRLGGTPATGGGGKTGDM